MSFRAPSAAAPSRVLLRAALTLSVAGAALAGCAGAAQADQQTAVGGALAGAGQSLGAGVGPVEHVRLDPMAGTPVDPLTNGVDAKVADFKPVGTGLLTRPLAGGDSLSRLPLVGRVGAALSG